MSRSGMHTLLMSWEEERRKAMPYFQKVDDSEPSVPGVGYLQGSPTCRIRRGKTSRSRSPSQSHEPEMT